MIDPVTQRQCMNEEEARRCAKMMKPLGKFTSVEATQIGGEFATPERGWVVEIWSVNAQAGNRNLHILDAIPATAAEAKRVARLALGRATARDRESLARVAAERQVDRE